MGGYKRTRKGQTKRMVKKRGKRTRKLKGGNDGDDFWMNTKKEELKRDIDITRKHLNYLQRKREHAGLVTKNRLVINDRDRKYFINALNDIIKGLTDPDDIQLAKDLLIKFKENKGLYKGPTDELLPQGEDLLKDFEYLLFMIDGNKEDILSNYNNGDAAAVDDYEIAEFNKTHTPAPAYKSEPYDVFESPESPYATTTSTSGEYMVPDTSSGDYYDQARNYGDGKNMYMTAVNDDD